MSAKYSQLNPKYTPVFLTFAYQTGLLRFLMLRYIDGVIQAFGGMLHFGQHATMPMVGYNTTMHRKDGLYRLICHADSL
ncbi:hypothetical protein SAMN05444000_10695 [Shimia gijangensis]|uniref:Uncharacterized protein n=1 Tax=Shimia gijangensis TaxID=1470563 RepID=A0A1M6HMG0_9RHOB|nr:hypothetical protein [Shimia gijangensis]SHJ23431.1 hypothetical protein SAMN05444000_10695 [Shimia gijangensis]